MHFHFKAYISGVKFHLQDSRQRCKFRIVMNIDLYEKNLIICYRKECMAYDIEADKNNGMLIQSRLLQEGVRYNYVKSNIIIFVSFLFTVLFVVTVSLRVASAFECLDCSEVPVECDAESCVPTSCTTSVPCVGYCLVATFPGMTSSSMANGSDPSSQNINGMFACINETNPEIVGKKHCQVLNYVMDRVVLGYDQLVTWI